LADQRDRSGYETDGPPRLNPALRPTRRILLQSPGRVERAYRGADRKPKTSNPGTVSALEAHLRAGGRPQNAPLVVQPGDRFPAGSMEILTEDNRTLPAPSRADQSLPFGYHTLIDRHDHQRHLIVSPGQCHKPGSKHNWGLSVQLYAARSAASWGMGDLGDLHTIERWSIDRGASYVLINPIHATTLVPPVQPSPYFPTSRRCKNPLFLRIEDVPGAREAGVALEPLARAGHALNQTALIDRDEVARLKLEALHLIWKHHHVDAGFNEFRNRMGEDVQKYAIYCALADIHGAQWSGWPAELQDVTSQAVHDFAAANNDAVSFHAWLQYLLELQIKPVTDTVRVMHDLAIGVERHGADTWCDPGLYAMDYSVGAPPDVFAALGQGWGFPPFDPYKLMEAEYRPFISTLRAAFASGGALRFDHTVGLFRLWWIPPGHSPFDGAYVRYPARDLLNILALESHRAQGWVVGEALGTVEIGVRPELARRNVLAYYLAADGRNLPLERYPVMAQTVVLTHDDPTLLGLWDGSDLVEQDALGRQPNVKDTEVRRQRLMSLSGLDRKATDAEVVEGVHAALARARSQLVAASLTDVALQRDRINMPGTTDDVRANWCIPLPAPLESVLDSPVATHVANSMRDYAGQDAP
jgi:4-alpha-glucanotransferase